jgi:hypothetical protein
VVTKEGKTTHSCRLGGKRNVCGREDCDRLSGEEGERDLYNDTEEE